MANIKSRASYKKFKVFLKEIHEAKTDKDRLMAMHKVIESYAGYRSRSNSTYALEAIKFISDGN